MVNFLSYQAKFSTGLWNNGFCMWAKAILNPYISRFTDKPVPSLVGKKNQQTIYYILGTS